MPWNWRAAVAIASPLTCRTGQVILCVAVCSWMSLSPATVHYESYIRVVSHVGSYWLEENATPL